ncbi:extracellular solute-binding protein family 3 [Arcobacter nitrofigilis DSM 7299]|uniref:Extracellular solute-binding protein family 3 n=1 Tax=Arcobacter nitrofigilis (strain ATCC 33309 / DSM 7299 / CCUG 15893 / LMG 7604 / NCTC 12251 / CI) TaxID=572480 RepID=D5V3B0_ARCNC|nr:ABC transporter substrate-binding protein [Arcobacter nitrofigilis]ADG92692.1 extracellular solute-binding protein family 3 [Arcobacter nitrofigilis DSM 7299]
MFKSILKKGALLTAGVMLLAISSELFADGAIKGNLRIVIGSKSTGGDTYQNSSIVAEALAKKLDINVKVDATGASSAFQALDRAGARGNTIMIFHDQAYLGYLYGKKGYFDIFSKYIIGPSIAINPGNAYLVPKNSPYKTIEDVMDACGKGKRVRVAIQPGGVSEIGYTALKNAISIKYPGKEVNLVAVNTGSQSAKNQLLFDGQADLINGSVQGNEQYTRLPADDQKAMRFVWLTARESTIKQAPAAGMGETTRSQLLKFVNPIAKVPFDSKTDFTFDKEFFFIYNKKLDPKIIAEIDNALSEIYASGEIQKVQKKSFFIPDFMPSKESEKYFKEKMERYKKIINTMR